MPRQKIPDFKCQQCPSIYLSETGLDNHIKKEHGIQGVTTTPSKTSLPTYVPRNKSSTFNCTICNFKYLEQSGLDQHMEKDHNIQMTTTASDVISPMTMVMNRPKKTLHSSSPNGWIPRQGTLNFKCSDCPPESASIYLTEIGLAKHVEKEHKRTPGKPITPAASFQTTPKCDWTPVDISKLLRQPDTDVSPPLLCIPSLASKRTDFVVENQVSKPAKKSAKKSKKNKDPNAPKRPLTAYFLFMGEERAKVKEFNPTFNVTEVAKELGERWKCLDSARKAQYEQLAAKEKERYDTEMKAYNVSEKEHSI